MNAKNLFVIAIFVLTVVIMLVSLFKKDTLQKNKPKVIKDLSKKAKVIDTGISDSAVNPENEQNRVKQEEITELKIEDLKVGDGKEAKSGDTVTVHYVGTLLDGTKFDSSRDRGQPFTFKLGAGQVIEGWDKGVVGMKVGGLRKLTIPANMAYGERGIGSIPPNSPLVFEVELISIDEGQNTQNNPNQ